MKTVPANIAELERVPNWLVYVETGYSPAKHHGNGGYNKLPYSAGTLTPAAWQKNVTDFRTAAARVGAPVQAVTKQGVFPAAVSGVGFFFGNRSGFIGIDLDDVYDGETGRMTAEAAGIVSLCGSYAEISPSGYGVHIIIRADNAPEFAPSERRAQNKTDIFTGGNTAEYQIINTGYMTMTGNEIPGSKPVRALTPAEWAQLKAFFLPAERTPEPAAEPRPQADTWTAPRQAPREDTPAGRTSRSDTLKELWFMEPTFLPRASDTSLRNKHPMYRCPKPGCPHGTHGDGICFVPGTEDHPYWKCFACGIYEDVPGLWLLSHPGSTFDDLRRYYGLDVPERRRPSLSAEDYPDERQSTAGSALYAPTAADALAATEYTRPMAAGYPPEDYAPADTGNSAEGTGGAGVVPLREMVPTTAEAEYMSTCEGRQAPALDYLKNRGISEETAKRAHIGYDPFRQAVVIPTGAASYVLRSTDPNADAGHRYKRHGRGELYGAPAAAAAEGRAVFLVEGEIDALSIMQAGGVAVATGGAGNGYRAVNWLKSLKEPRPPVVIALDNDEPGHNAAGALEQLLTAEHLSFYRPENLYDGAKDANAALLADAAGLAERIKAVEKQVVKTPEERYRETNTAGACASLLKGADAPKIAIATGIHTLDNYLHGGLRAGLYLLGAVTSLGKTSLVLQIADHIAAAGHDVLYISLEMAARELVAKSLSRITCEIGDERAPFRGFKNRIYAWDTVDILDGLSRPGDEKMQYLREAADIYQNTIAPHMFIRDSVGGFSAEDIKRAVAEHVDMTGTAPVLVVDYMQIISPFDPRATDKTNADHNVIECKRISKDYDIPCIGISSYNRAAYNSQADLSSQKDSGGFEYSADVVLGLQYYGVGVKGFDVTKARTDNPRKVELCVLKNRNGKIGKPIPMEFHSKFNLFREVEKWPTCGETQIH